MAGIIAVAASADVTSGETATDKNASGFLTAERIALSTTPTGSSYTWGLAKPQGATARSDLDDDTSATPLFTPDVPGVYNITCSVDGTDYTLRITVTQLAQSTPLEAVRFSPVTDSAVPAPSLGAALYYSSDREGLALKLPDGTVSLVNRVLVDDEFALVNSSPTEVASFEAEADTIYVVRGEVYADDGSDPTFKTVIRHIGNNQAGTFTEITADGGLNWSIVASSGAPGTIPITMQVSGPTSPLTTHVRFWIESQFSYTDV